MENGARQRKVLRRGDFQVFDAGINQLDGLTDGLREGIVVGGLQTALPGDIRRGAIKIGAENLRRLGMPEAFALHRFRNEALIGRTLEGIARRRRRACPAVPCSRAQHRENPVGG